MPVRDVCFNNGGDEFLSASFDTFVKLWDTETGQVKNRFHHGHRVYCVKFNPDEDKQNIFLAGTQNKKITQWDTRSGEITQVVCIYKVLYSFNHSFLVRSTFGHSEYDHFL